MNYELGIYNRAAGGYETCARFANGRDTVKAPKISPNPLVAFPTSFLV